MRPRTLVIITLLISATGCGPSEGASPTSPTSIRSSIATASTPHPAEAPDEPPPSSSPVPTTKDAVMIYGTSSCEMTSGTTTWEDGRAVIVESFECRQEMSDPRASGIEISTSTSWGLGTNGGGGTWVSDDAVLRNDEGTWRGTSSGVYAKTDRLPNVDTAERYYTWGVSSYVGDGVYEGLELRVYAAGTVSEPVLTGWIRPIEPSGDGDAGT